MYQKFTATQIGTDIETKQIRIMFSNELDPDSINDQTVYLNDIKGQEFKALYSVDNNEVLLTLSQEIVPNEKYVLWITKDVKNIMGEGLAVRVRKEIIFKTTIRAEIEITNPYDFQEIENGLIVDFQEHKIEEEDELCSSYLIQVADSHLFENIVIESLVSINHVQLSGFKNSGQYYIRARAQKNSSDYGPWSKPKTIIVNVPSPKEETIEDIFVQEASILTTPDNGVTHKSFLIEFDGDIDVESILENGILLLQKKV